MELLIASDSHGNVPALRKMMRGHPEARYLLFLGDGLSDLSFLETEYPDVIVYAVRGNCDRFDPTSDAPVTRLVTPAGIRVMMTHGHAFGVKGGYGAAIAEALREGADVLLCGHTHIPTEEGIRGKEKILRLFNPGSIGQRTDGTFHYGVLTVKDGAFLLSHGTLSM